MDLRRYVDALNAENTAYHRLDFGDGIVLAGQVDPTRFLDVYTLPKDLSGRSVLDIGTSTGFFAFECAKRGARVTAIDVFDLKIPTELARLAGLDISFVGGTSVYDLDASFGSFDLVICGSMLMHIPDPIGAVRAMRTVCNDRLLLSSFVYRGQRGKLGRCSKFTGVHVSEGDYWSYWLISAQGLAHLCTAAGFFVNRRDHFVVDVLMENGIWPVEHVIIDGQIHSATEGNRSISL